MGSQPIWTGIARFDKLERIIFAVRLGISQGKSRHAVDDLRPASGGEVVCGDDPNAPAGMRGGTVNLLNKAMFVHDAVARFKFRGKYGWCGLVCFHCVCGVVWCGSLWFVLRWF